MTIGNRVFIGGVVYFFIFIFGVGGLFVWKVKRRGGRRPVDFKLLRGPGETLRRRIAKFDEDSFLHFLSASLVPPGVTLLILWIMVKFHLQTWTELWIYLGVAALVFAVSVVLIGRMMFAKLKRYRDDCLGYMGEREVAEHLVPLLAQGYRIFHDVPCKGAKADFNLDHVAVGRAGVALIETKTLRKGRTLPGKKDHVVEYNGDQLFWPWGTANRYGLDQAVNETEWLRKFIRERTNIETAVKPIVALPGWWVEQKGRGAISVVNSKNVASEVERMSGRVLSVQEIDLIARQLDVLCRDVVD